jgi:ABC-type nitrate/sulfonate/bicarbonate transport system substrate-binding protein
MPSSCTVALDWTPNTNHAGFYVAQADGLYASAGLEVTLLSPDAASAGGETSARLVEALTLTLILALTLTLPRWQDARPARGGG